VYLNADLAAPGVSAKSLVFGDLRLGYCVRRVRGVGLDRQLELHSDSGQIGYRLYERVDGKPTLAAAAIIGQHSAS
jgi:HK97 family phage major capsid protein